MHVYIFFFNFFFNIRPLLLFTSFWPEKSHVIVVEACLSATDPGGATVGWLLVSRVVGRVVGQWSRWWTGPEERRASEGGEGTVGQGEGGGQHQEQQDKREGPWRLQSTGLKVIKMRILGMGKT